VSSDWSISQSLTAGRGYLHLSTVQIKVQTGSNNHSLAKSAILKISTKWVLKTVIGVRKRHSKLEKPQSALFLSVLITPAIISNSLTTGIKLYIVLMDSHCCRPWLSKYKSTGIFSHSTILLVKKPHPTGHAGAEKENKDSIPRTSVVLEDLETGEQ